MTTARDFWDFVDQHADHGTASCAETDPESYFPELGRYDENSRTAKRVCAGCELREQCLEWALATGPMVGIYGGTTPNERRALRRARKAAA